jgi:hypothetical protein
MWPFKKRPPKTDLTDETNAYWMIEEIADLRSFRDVGETFIYLGRTCVVTSHWSEVIPYVGFHPLLRADYADDCGVIRSISFRRSELVGLRAMNPAPGPAA